MDVFINPTQLIDCHSILLLPPILLLYVIPSKFQLSFNDRNIELYVFMAWVSLRYEIVGSESSGSNFCSVNSRKIVLFELLHCITLKQDTEIT